LTSNNTEQQRRSPKSNTYCLVSGTSGGCGWRNVCLAKFQYLEQSVIFQHPHAAHTRATRRSWMDLTYTGTPCVVRFRPSNRNCVQRSRYSSR
jgi:hypothetical protein